MSDPLDAVVALLSEALDALGAPTPDDHVRSALAAPPRPEMGDFAFPAFPYAKALRRSPAAIAAEIAAHVEGRLADHPEITCVEAAGPYVNFTFDRVRRAQRVITAASAPGYGQGTDGAGRTLGIDYSAPNIAKPFGIGHLRSTVIGNALRRIHAFLGWDVIGVNHLGDWGTQFGKLMAAFERWGDEARMQSEPIRHLYDLYVRFHQEAEDNPALEEEGRAWFRRLEQQDADAVRYWERFRELSLREFQRIYERLGVSFDHYWGEAFYNDKLEPLVDDLRARGLLQESDGAQVVPLDDLELPPCLILKSDGASLYATRDLAAARYRHETLQTDRFLYVVGAAQSVHFQQVFAVLKRMDLPWAEELIHVPFGMILGISTRKGTLIFLEDVLDRGRDLAREVLSTRPGLDDATRETIADQIAVGAIVLADLTRNRMRDYPFDWDQMLDWNGRTGPYLQYTHVRLGSLIEKFASTHPDHPGPAVDAAPDALDSAHIRAIVQRLEQFPALVRSAADALEPSLITRYLFDLAEDFNSWYSSGVKLITDDAHESAARIAVAGAVRSVLASGLDLLGVPRPERM